MKRPNYVERIEVRLREKLVVQINGQPYRFSIVDAEVDSGFGHLDFPPLRVTLLAYPVQKRRVTR